MGPEHLLGCRLPFPRRGAGWGSRRPRVCCAVLTLRHPLDAEGRPEARGRRRLGLRREIQGGNRYLRDDVKDELRWRREGFVAGTPELPTFRSQGHEEEPARTLRRSRQPAKGERGTARIPAKVVGRRRIYQLSQRLLTIGLPCRRRQMRCGGT